MRTYVKSLAAATMMWGLLLAQPGLAQADAPLAPSAEPTASFSLSAGVVRTVLPNGLVVLVREQHDQNTVAVELITRVGQSSEDSANAGITDLLSRMLERKVSRDPGKDNNVVEEAGADVHTGVTPDYTELALDTTSDHARPLFDRLLNAYKTRSFTQDEMDTSRVELLHDLEGEQRIFKAIYDIFLEAFYRSHPYHAPQEGNPHVMRLLTLDTLNAFVDRRYVPNRTVIAVVGDITNAQVLEQIKHDIGSMAAVPDRAPTIDWAPSTGSRDLSLGPGSNLAWIFLGYPAPNMGSPDYAAMRTMHAMLGEGVSSRLWVDLRENHGMAYELGSIYPVLQGPSHFVSYLITTPKQVDEAKRRMLSEMDRLRNEDVPEAELDQARWKVIGETLLAEETTAGKAFSLATYEAQGAGYDFSDKFMADVRKVSPADIRRVAFTYLRNEMLIVARPPSN